MAISGPLRIALTPLPTVEFEQALQAILLLIEEYEIETIVFGESNHKDGTENKHIRQQKEFVNRLKKSISSTINIDYVDESFTSVEAKEIILSSGTKKKKRRNKALVDQVSSVIILRRYLESLE